MKAFTKEQLIEHANKHIAHAESYRAQLVLLEMALAGMEQKPVGWMTEVEVDELHRGLAEEAYIYRVADCASTIPLYAAPQLPQPAVAITQHFDTIELDTAKMVMCDVNRRDEFLGGDIQLLSRIQCRIDDACRAAMLQGKTDVALTNEGNMPATQIKPVADLYGITSPTGSETSFTFDAVEARDFIDGGWSCQQYVELERYQSAMLQGGNHAEQHLDMVDHSGDTTEKVMLQAVNSPVIPDGWQQWISDVSEYLENGLEADCELEAQGSIDAKRLLARRAAMLAAAPQQEAE